MMLRISALLCATFFSAFALNGAYAAERIPGGGKASASSGEITQAYYGSPTTRYGHGVLGDAIEGGSLHVKTSGGKELSVTLEQAFVFEDITPRLADLDGDGTAEVITILSSLKEGGSLAVFGLKDGALTLVARTPFIGRTNRWLNIAGIAKFSGNARPEIALVKTPHLGGALEFWRLRNNALVKIASAPSFSNHAIGSTSLGLSAIADANGDGLPDLYVPAAGRQSLRLMSFSNGQLKELENWPLSAPASGNFSFKGRDLIVPLAGGKQFIVDGAKR